MRSTAFSTVKKAPRPTRASDLSHACIIRPRLCSRGKRTTKARGRNTRRTNFVRGRNLEDRIIEHLRGVVECNRNNPEENDRDGEKVGRERKKERASTASLICRPKLFPRAVKQMDLCPERLFSSRRKRETAAPAPCIRVHVRRHGPLRRRMLYILTECGRSQSGAGAP